MAHPEHIRQLKRGRVAWNRWRGKNPTTIPDLSRANLSGISLNSTNLTDALINNTILAGTDLRHADLKRANLRFADLSSSNLVEADLRGANLSFANLMDAKLTRARLAKASLEKTNLSGADLSDAELIETNLRGAILSFTNLRSANLTATIFENTRLGYTIFGDVDLSGAKDLLRARHWGPSVIGVDTLLRSHGSIPDPFLRDSGVSEDMILDLMPRLQSGLRTPCYSCFISYGHADKAFARLLHDRLQRQGIRCWLDEHQLLPGDDIHDRIDQGIRLWDKVLLCASKSSLTSWWVDGEISRAFQKEAQIMKERGKKVLALIPLNLDGFLFSADYESGKKAQIKSRIAANFVGWEKDSTLFERELERVVRALRTQDGGRELPPQSRL